MAPPACSSCAKARAASRSGSEENKKQLSSPQLGPGDADTVTVLQRRSLSVAPLLPCVPGELPMEKRSKKKINTGSNFQMAPGVQHLNLAPPQEQRQLPDCYLQAFGPAGWQRAAWVQPTASAPSCLPATTGHSWRDLTLAQVMLDKHSNDPLHPEPCKTCGGICPAHRIINNRGTEWSSRDVIPLHENHQKSVTSTVSPETSLATTATRDDFHHG